MEAWRQWLLGGRKTWSTKPEKNCIDSDRPSHGSLIKLMPNPLTEFVALSRLRRVTPVLFRTRRASHLLSALSTHPLRRWAAVLHRINNLVQKANETVETSYPEPPEFIAQGDRVLVVGFARGRIKATNRTFEDHWVFAITIRNGKVTNIREYVDTQALARASETAEPPALTHRAVCRR
jgi:ketosteroid isomerase-like protein